MKEQNNVTLDSIVNEIIDKLDNYGRKVDDYQFGLPRHPACEQIMSNMIKKIIIDKRKSLLEEIKHIEGYVHV